MYQYVDGNGRLYVLETGNELKLLCTSAPASKTAASRIDRQEKILSQQEYMRIVLAFCLAIDNKICQCELGNAHTGMIIALEEEQQRRYFLSPDTAERRELEGLLHACL
jgi:hypothetical protein